MEKSDLEAERVALFESVIQNQRSMKEFESNLLHKLSSIQVNHPLKADTFSRYIRCFGFFFFSFRAHW